MRLSARLRTCPLVWLLPLLLAFAATAYRLDTDSLDALPPYSVAITGLSTIAMPFIAPLCAAAAAWEAGRLRRAGWWKLPLARPRLWVVVDAVLPVWLVGVLCVFVAAMWPGLLKGSPMPFWGILLPETLVLAAHTLVGFALGLLLPAVVVVPSLIVLDYVWMAMPASLEPLWLRHLTGVWDSCCSLSSTIDFHAVAGALFLALGSAAAAACMIVIGSRALAAVLAVVCLLVGASAGVASVRSLNADPVVARDMEVQVCAGTNPRICLWPEHRQLISRVAPIAHRAYVRWWNAGLSPRSSWQEGYLPSDLPVVYRRGFALDPKMKSWDIVYAMTNLLLPPPPACVTASRGWIWAGADAEESAQAWLAATAGMPRTELLQRFNPRTVEKVELVRQRTQEQQLEWFRSAAKHIEDCQAVTPPVGSMR